jgi:hypothetical protein
MDGSTPICNTHILFHCSFADLIGLDADLLHITGFILRTVRNYLLNVYLVVRCFRIKAVTYNDMSNLYYK